DRVGVHGQQHGAHAEPGGGERGLDAGVSGADDDHVVVVGQGGHAAISLRGETRDRRAGRCNGQAGTACRTPSISASRRVTAPRGSRRHGSAESETGSRRLARRSASILGFWHGGSAPAESPYPWLPSLD